MSVGIFLEKKSERNIMMIHLQDMQLFVRMILQWLEMLLTTKEAPEDLPMDVYSQVEPQAPEQGKTSMKPGQ